MTMICSNLNLRSVYIICNYNVPHGKYISFLPCTLPANLYNATLTQMNFMFKAHK